MRAVTGLALTVLLLPCPMPAFGQCPPDALFGAGYSVGDPLQGPITTADFNEDGILDIAHGYTGCAVADFNGDGILDVATSRTASVRLGMGSGGRGAGNFFPSAYLGAGSTGGTTTDSIAVMLGRGVSGVGDGTFSVQRRFATHRYPGHIIAADVTGDGIVDLIIGKTNDVHDSIAFSILPGSADGTFGPPTTYQFSAAFSGSIWGDIFLDDFDKDGRRDLLVLTNYQALLWAGLPDGVFQQGVATSAIPFYNGAAVVADFNGDTHPDLASAQGAIGVSVYLNRGGGPLGLATFLPEVRYTWTSDCNWCNQPYGLASGDFNQDGLTDLAVTGQRHFLPELGNSVETVAVLVAAGQGGNPTGGFLPPTFLVNYAGPSNYLAVGDFLEDGIPDILSGYAAVLFPGRCPSADAAPNLLSVSDVPYDQGGRVSVRWNRSPYDASSVRLITQYAIWRRIAPQAAMSKGWPIEADAMRAIYANERVVRVTRNPETQTSTFWEDIGRTTAHFLDGYGYTAATTQDSMRLNNPYTAFFVSALTEDPFVFFESNVDSGYSVDNLVPGTVQGLASHLLEPGVLRISWHPNAEPDISHYSVYKGPDPSFTPTDPLRIAMVQDTTYVDNTFGGPANYYKVTAVDIHGNESHIPTLVSTGDMRTFGTTLEVPFELPNGQVRLDYTLAQSAANVRLEVFDVAGRRVWASMARDQQRGTHELIWQRARASRGLYLARLTTPSATARRKFILSSR